MQWTREGMATLAALNVLVINCLTFFKFKFDWHLFRKRIEHIRICVFCFWSVVATDLSTAMLSLSILQGKIKGYPIWSDPNRVVPFLNENVPPPAACPSIVNAKALGNIHISNIITLFLKFAGPGIMSP